MLICFLKAFFIWVSRSASFLGLSKAPWRILFFKSCLNEESLPWRPNRVSAWVEAGILLRLLQVRH